jgi:hypothetical protein
MANGEMLRKLLDCIRNVGVALGKWDAYSRAAAFKLGGIFAADNSV